jgi:CRISPR system Cascade subunit CasD
MQSWGTKSRFDERDTEMEPSKSGVIGLVCAALGIDRNDEAGLLELATLKLGIRVEREGMLRRDYHTAQEVISADGEDIKDTAVSHRYYLADAVFLVGLGGDNISLLERIQEALKNPHWPLSFGRKAFVPSKPVWLEDGLQDKHLEDALRHFGQLTDKPPTRLVLESLTGSMRLDQPLSSFAKRRFGVRFVETKFFQNLPAYDGSTYVPESTSP